MFIVVKKVHTRRLLAGAAVIALTAALVGAGTELACGSVSLSQPVSGAQRVNEPVRSNEDRVAYLTRLGWEVSREPASIEEVLIPETFDDSYEEYLALQAGQGFDLTKYAGKTAKRYTYPLLNFPGLPRNVWASLLLYRHTVIGGEVFGSDGDGFAQGLQFPGRDG